MRSTPQKSTESTPRGELTAKQLAVISALASGQTISAAAKLADVDRGSVYNWLKKDAVFVAELNREKQDRDDVLRAQFRAMIPDALTGLAESLKPDTKPEVRLRACMHVLQVAGIMGAQTAGPTDEEAIEEERESAERFRLLTKF